MSDFVIHACEQVLRFTTIDKWGSLSEERKQQLSFNMGVVALGLNLTKEESFQPLIDACQEKMSTKELHKHFRRLFTLHKITVDEDNVTKPF
ncbi:MAG: hypothetical protein R3B60_01890 [Candidatus Paceibacterota bacterium]